MNNKKDIQNFEDEMKNVLNYLNGVKGMLKLNKNDFDVLNDSSKEIEQEISEFIVNLENFQKSYNKSIKEILKTFEEDTIKILSVLNIETISGKKLDLNVNVILTIIPISVMISCKEYKLIKEEKNNDNLVPFEQYFKLDVNVLKGDEQINLELLNYKEKEPIEFYLNAKSLDNNSSNIPDFPKNKQKNNIKIKIPKYDYDSKIDEIPRLHCKLEIMINKNFVIYIIIDALLRPVLNIFKMYDFYSKSYIEN